MTVSSAGSPGTVAADPDTILLDGRQVVSVSFVRENTGQDRQERQVVPLAGTASTQIMSPQGHSASAVATLLSDLPF